MPFQSSTMDAHEYMGKRMRILGCIAKKDGCRNSSGTRQQQQMASGRCRRLRCSSSACALE